MSLSVENPRSEDIKEEVDGDRLSDLPLPLIHHIFSFLDTIEIIRARSVCRKWRDLWVSMAQFNLRFARSFWSRTDVPITTETYGKFKDYVNWVLTPQDGSSNILSCHLQYINLANDDSIHRWMNLLFQRNVRRLYLYVIVAARDPIELPPFLVTCESMVNFVLHSNKRCVFNLPTCAFSSRIKNLNFTSIVFVDEVLLRNFISNCPLLQHLFLQGCIFRDFKILRISATRLKVLVIEYRQRIPDDGLGTCEVMLDCPHLESFTFKNTIAKDLSFLMNPIIIHSALIQLVNPPSHATLQQRRGVMLKILNALRNVRIFNLSVPLKSMFFDPADAKPVSFSIPFNNLKGLATVAAMEDYYLETMMNLLKCFPALEILSLYIYTNDRICNIPNETISCLKYALKMVKLHRFQGTQNELKFVRFLLKHGQILQKMEITWRKDVENSKVIIEQVMKVPRSSSNVTVKFFEPEES